MNKEFLGVEAQGIRGSESPSIKWVFIKTWLVFAIFLMLYMLKEIGLPIYEGWWHQSGLIAGLGVWFIPMFWLARPLLWGLFNARNPRSVTELIVGIFIFLAAGWFSFSAVTTLYKNTVEGTVVMTTNDYEVESYNDCGDRGGLRSCRFVGYFILIGDTKHKQGMEINKDTYEWLEHNSFKKKVTENRMTSMVDVVRPITINYKPKAKIVFDIRPTE